MSRQPTTEHCAIVAPPSQGAERERLEQDLGFAGEDLKKERELTARLTAKVADMEVALQVLQSSNKADVEDLLQKLAVYRGYKGGHIALQMGAKSAKPAPSAQ